MHIVLVAPLVSPIDTRRSPLGGAQAVVGDLAEGLGQRGHQVTLLAADGSYVRGAEVPWLGIDAAALAPADFTRGARRTDTAVQRLAFQLVRQWIEKGANGIDVVHAHAYDAPAITELDRLSAPVVHTLHLPPVDPEVVAAARSVVSDVRFAAVSQASSSQWQAEGVPIKTVLNAGLAISKMPFRAEAGDYLLFAGRITPEKGPDTAIDVADRAGLPLLVVGDIYDEAFYKQEVEPRVRVRRDHASGQALAPGTTYIGPRPRAELWEFMAGAAAVLMPVRWDEPFGIVALEAQATGTPVIAYRRGGLTEVVSHGRSGWLVNPDDQNGFLDSVTMLRELDRTECRAWIDERFSLRAMLTAHELLYDRVRGKHS